MADTQTDPTTQTPPAPQSNLPSIPDTTNYASELASTMQGLGVDYWGGAGEQYAVDVLEMETTGRQNVGKIQLPPGVGSGDFLALLSDSEAFAASAGWSKFPTGQQLNEMMGAGLYTKDQADVFKWLAQNEGVAKSMPWAAAGMTHTQWDSTRDQLQSTIADYTGDPNMFGELVSQAMGHGQGASAWLHTQLTTNKSYTNNPKTPWLKFGMTYQSWQDYKRQNRAKVQAQYGVNATEQQFAQTIEDAAPSRSAAGGAATLPSGSSAMVQTGNQSQVR